MPSMNQKLCQKLFQTTGTAMLVLRNNGFVEVNPGAAAMFNGLPGQMLGKSLPDFSPEFQPNGEASAQLWQRTVEAALAGQPQQLEWWCQPVDGPNFFVELNLDAVWLDDQPYLYLVLHNISRYKQTEAALVESREMLQLIANTIPQLIFWKDINSVYMGCNQHFADAAGVGSPAGIVGKTDYDLPWKPSEAEFFRQVDRRVMDNNAPELHIIETQLRADGKQTWVDTNKMPLHNTAGTVVGILGTYEDITERMQMETTLRESESRLRAFVNALPDVAFIHNAAGCYLEVLVSEDNARYANIAKSLKGRYIAEVIPPQYADQFLAVIRQALDTQKPQTLEYSLREGVWYEGRVLPIKDDEPENRRVVWLARDISERKQLERQIQESLARSEWQSRLSTLVSQDAVASGNLDEFYQHVVSRVNEQFGLYYTQLLRLNPAEGSLKLAAGYGEVGQKLAATDFQVKLGEGLVGLAAGTGAMMVQSEAAPNPFWRSHPLLPHTKTELAIPLLFGTENAQSQLTALQTFINAGFDGFIVHAIDTGNVTAIARSAREQNRHVIAVGNDLGPANQTTLIATRDRELGYLLGRQAGEWAVKHIPPGQPLRLGMLTYSQISTEVVSREQAILEGIEEIFGDNFVVIEETAGDPIRGRAAAQTWLAEYPNLNMILGINDGGALGAHYAVIAAGKDQPDKFFVGGIDAVPEALAAIKTGGAYQATVTQSPEQIGRLAVRTMVAAIKGLPVETAQFIEYLPVNPANIDEVMLKLQQWNLPDVADDPLAGLDLGKATVGISMLNMLNPFYIRLVNAAVAEANRLGLRLVSSDSRQVLGVLNLHSNTPGQLITADLQLLYRLAQQIAITIENVQLYQEANSFRQFAEAAGQGFGMATLQGQVVYMNVALQQMLGERNLSAVVGKSFIEYFTEGQRQFLIEEVFATAMKQGQWHGEVELKTLAGKIIPTIQNVFIIRDDKGAPLYIATAVTDISEQKRTAAELEARVQELNALQRLMVREGWQNYQPAQTDEVLGYVFNSDTVQPLQPAGASLPPANDHTIINPVTVHGEVVATLGVVANPDQPLTAEDEAFLSSISAQVAEAMERARLLEQTHKRAVELEAVSQLATVASTAPNQTELLQTVVDLAKEKFGLYHAHIYLLNQAGNSLDLAAGAGDVGRQMVAQGWHIDLAQPDSIVARAAQTRQGVIANDVRQAATFLPNPLLPLTRSELAVPLLAGDELLGVLDVQAGAVNRFTNEDVYIQTALASQVAVAIQNARQYQQTQRQAAIIDSSEILVSAADPSGHAVFLNRKGLQMLGYTDQHELIGKPMREFFAPSQLEKYDRQILPQLLAEGSWQGETALQSRDGREIPVDQSLFLVRDNRGEVQLIATNASDITERKRAQEAIQRNEELLRNIINATPDWIFITDKEHRYQLVNKSYAESRNLTPEAIIGKTALEIGIPAEIVKGDPANQIKGFWPDDEEVLTTGQMRLVDVEPTFVKNEPRFISSIKIPLANAEGEYNALLCYVRDITEREQLLLDTEQQAQRLTLLNEMSTALSQAVELRDVYRIVAEKTLQVVGGDQVSIAIELPATSEFEIFALNGPKDPRPITVRLPIKGTAIEWTVQSGQLTVLVGEDCALYPDSRRLYAQGFLASMFAPLVSGGKAVGAISISSKKLTVYGLREQSLLQQISTLLAAAIENRRLLAETQMSLQETAMLYRVTRSLAQVGDQQRMFEQLLTEYLRQLKLPQGRVLIFDNDMLHGTFVALMLNGQLAKPGQRFAVANYPVYQRLITTKEAVVIANAATDPMVAVARPSAEEPGYKSMLLMPMVVRGKVIGALGADAPAEVHHFTERELTLVRSVADQLGVALERRYLLEETRAALEEVELTQRRYTLQTWESYQAKRDVAVYQQVREGLTVAKDNLPPGIDEAVAQKKTMVFTLPLAASGNQPGSAAQSNLVVPLKVRDEVIGVLGLQQITEARYWSADDVALVETVAEQMALAAENLRLLDETQLRAAREKRVNEIGEKIQAAQSLEEALQIAIREVGVSLQAIETSVKLEVN